MAAATTGRATLSDGVDMAVSPACPELCAYARSLDVDNVDAGRIAEQFGLISEPIDLNIGTEASDDLCIACNEGIKLRSMQNVHFVILNGEESL